MNTYNGQLSIKDYTTNCGVCFIVQDEHQNLIFATSDYIKFDEFILKRDSEIYVGREFFFIDTEKNYRITKIYGYGNSDTAIDIDDLCGKENKFSFKVILTVEEIQS